MVFDDFLHINLADIASTPLGAEIGFGADRKLLIESEGVWFPVLIRVSKRYNSRLLVMYNGAVDRERSKSGLVFQRSSWVDDFNATRVHFADPTILEFPDMSIGWGQLSRERWGIEVYVEILNELRKALLLPTADRTLHYGSSAGGHQAIMTAALDRGSRCLANNPQTDITKYWPGHQARLYENIFQDDPKGTQTLVDTPWRLKCVEMFRKQGYVPPLEIVTNVNSSRDFDLQFIPFIRAMNGLVPGKNSVTFEGYWDPEGGHRALSRKETRIRINRTLDRFDATLT